MAESFDAVLATDELISALAERRAPAAHEDPVVDALASLVEFVDSPVAPAPTAARPAGSGRRTLRGRRRVGLAIGVALACTSSGIAAAVTGDPLSPVTFVARHLVLFGHDLGIDRSSSPPDRQLASTRDHVQVAPHRAEPRPVDAAEQRHPPREGAAAPRGSADEPPSVVAPGRHQAPSPVVTQQQTPAVDPPADTPAPARHTAAPEPESPPRQTSDPPSDAGRERHPSAEPTDTDESPAPEPPKPEPASDTDDTGTGNRLAPEPAPEPTPDPDPEPTPAPDPATEPPGPVVLSAPGHDPDAPLPSPAPPPHPCQTPGNSDGRPDCVPGPPEHPGHDKPKPDRTVAEASTTGGRTVR